MTCKKGLSISLFVFVLLFVLYYPARYSPTLILEENSVLQLPVLSHAGNIPLIFSQDFMLFSQGQYRPLSYVILAILRTVVSANSLLFWHLLLLGVHAINVILLFALILQFTPRLRSAWIGATLFCLHPLCTVIVNDINQFHILLGITFCAGTLYCYFAFRTEQRKLYYYMAILFYLLSLFTSRQGYTTAIILLCFELIYYRSQRRTLIYMLPFLLLPVILSPLLFMSSPHPLHYKYIEANKDSLWFSLYSVIGGTWIFFKGIILTLSFPAVLHETVQRIFKASNPLFLISLCVHLILLITAIAGLYLRRWFFLGILIIYCSMIPYSTVYINRAVEYVSWTYFYFTIAGLSLFFAGLFVTFSCIENIPVKRSLQIILVIPLLFWGCRTYQFNKNTADPLAYWSGIGDLGTTNLTASHHLGKWYLSKGDESQALLHLFTPNQDSIAESCLAMSRYYCQKGDYLASAIHLHYGSFEKPIGIVLEKQCLAAGDLLLALGALDHADDNFGKVLMVNPFNTTAMCKLAQTWFKKGFVKEGLNMLARARRISPNEPEIIISEDLFRKTEQKYTEGMQKLEINPPSPAWLAYLVLNQKRSSIRQQIVELSKIANPNDPIIPLEAMISLIEENKFQEAVRYANPIYNRLPKYTYAEAAVCEVLAQSGETDNAIQIGLKAVAQDTKSELALRKLALAYALKGETTLDPRFEKLLAANPTLAQCFTTILVPTKYLKIRIPKALPGWRNPFRQLPQNRKSISNTPEA